MVEILLVVAVVVSALIHLAPAVGVLSVQRLQQLYGTAVDGPDLAVMMRHRALLFGVLGSLLLVSVVVPDLRWPMVTATLVSDLGFVALMRAHPGTGPEMARVLRADLVSIALLAAAVALMLVP